MDSLCFLRVISHLHVGGVQRQLRLVFREMASRGHSPEVCCIKDRGAQAADFEAEGFPVHFVPFRSRFDPLGMLQLRLLASRRRIQVVHGHMYNANMAVNGAFALPRGGIRTVNGYHNQILVSNERQERRVRRSATAPNAFVAVGESVKETLVSIGIPDDRITVIHNGVVGPETPVPMPRRAAGEPLHLLWAGRFVKQKRVELLVEAVRACRDRAIPVRLVLLGDGPVEGKVRQLVTNLGLEEWVQLPGVTDDVLGWLAKADMYVSASYREGFPNALLEACAAGRPFLVSDIPPHAELKGGRRAGSLVPPDPEKWAEAIACHLARRSELPTMAEEALAIGRKYSIAAACDRTEELYRRLLED